jgi:hypothetical protein
LYFGANRFCVLQSNIEQVVASGVTGIPGVHCGCGNPNNAERTRAPLNRTGERVRVVRFLAARRWVCDVDPHPTPLKSCWIRWNTIFLEARFSGSGPEMEAPLVPRTNDVVAFKVAFAEWAANVVAGGCDGAEDTVFTGQRETRPTNRNGLH